MVALAALLLAGAFASMLLAIWTLDGRWSDTAGICAVSGALLGIVGSGLLAGAES